MSLLDDIKEKVNVSNEEIRIQRRRMAFLMQLQEIKERKDIYREDLMEELGIDSKEEYMAIISNPSLRDIAKIENVLDEDILVFKRNLKFINDNE